MNILLKSKLLVLISIYIFYTLPVAQAGDAQSIPLQPKGTPINSVNPAALVIKQSDVTMMADDPFVVKQFKNTARINNNAKKPKENRKAVKANTDQSSLETEVIKLPISETSVKVKNKGDKFFFVDITDRMTNAHSAGSLTMTTEMRHLQVEALRQATAKRKRK